MTEDSGRDRIERWSDFPGRTPEEIWHVVGKFADIDVWHPAVEKCEAVSLDGVPHRHVTVKGDGGMILEKLIQNDHNIQRYEIVEGPLPVENYRATLTVFREGDGARVFWSASFEPTDPNADAIVANIFETGLDALQERFGT